MHDDIIPCGDGFWNIRGHFKIAGVLNIGTQASLVRLADGSFTILDSYSFAPETLTEIDRITGARDAVTRVINTHPFHTIHAKAMHAAFPAAAHHGTARHKRLFAELNWAALNAEDPALWASLAPDLAFSRPDGVEFIPANENIHCASILAYHPASGAIHVDDTFNYRLLKLGKKGRLSVHPTLRMALQKRPGAAADFRAWGAKIVADWAEAKTICTAHNGVLGAADLADGHSVAGAMKAALARTEKTLKKHEKRWG